jgi:hypothetical protein
MQRMLIKKCFCLRWKCLSHKAVHSWVEKFCERRSKFSDDAGPDRPVGTETEATM